MKMAAFLILFGATIGSGAFAFFAKDVPVAQTFWREREEIIYFDQDGIALANTETEALVDFCQRARDHSATVVKIAVWSDLAFTGENEPLSPTQVGLAEERGKILRNRISELLPGVKVSVFNMAAPASIFSKFFDTDEAELKDAEQRIVNGTDLSPDSIVMWEDGGPATAVLLFEGKNGNKPKQELFTH